MRRVPLVPLVLAALSLTTLLLPRTFAQHPHDVDLSKAISVDTEVSPFHMFSRDIVGVRLIGSGGQVIEPEAELFRGLILFADLEPDVYTLRIDDPRFEPWSREGLEPGKRQVALLKRNSGVTLNVIDDATGDPLPKYGLSVRFDEAPWRPNEYKLQSARRRPPKDGFVPLPAAPCTLILSAKGYGPLELTVDDLEVGEKRAVTIRMSKSVRITGRVLQHDGAPGPGGAFLHVRRPGAAVTHYEPGFSLNGSQPIAPLMTTRADESGAFEIDLAPGEYALHAIQDPWHAASIDPFVVTPESGGTEALLRLPPGGRLTGQIVDHAPEAMSGYRILAAPQTQPDHLWMFLRIGSVPLRSDGSFQLELLPAGRTRLFAFKPSAAAEEEHGLMDQSLIPLGEVEINLLETQHAEFALRDKLPGRLTVTLIVDGEAGAAYVTTLVSTEDADITFSAGCDARGIADFEEVPAGTYRVHFSPHVHERRFAVQWSSMMADELVIGAVTSTQLRHELALSTCRVQIVRAEDGEPLAESLIGLRHLHGIGPIGPTDANGWLELSLPPGLYHLQHSEEVDPHRKEGGLRRTGLLRWTSAGPKSVRVEMSQAR